MECSNGAVNTAFDIQVVGKRGPGRPKMTWKQLTERDCREWKFSAIDPYDRDTWTSGVSSACSKPVTWKGVNCCYLYLHVNQNTMMMMMMIMLWFLLVKLFVRSLCYSVYSSCLWCLLVKLLCSFIMLRCLRIKLLYSFIL